MQLHSKSEIKVLTVDDNTKILFAFDILLKKEGCLSIHATSGREGLRQISEHKPNAVFLDLSLPDTDGITVLKQIKQQYPKLPVIIITGHGSDQIQREALQNGAHTYLEKPISVEKIRIVLDQIRNAKPLGSL